MLQPHHRWLELDLWYQQPLGQAVSHAVHEQLSHFYPKCFGHHALQIGLASQTWLHASPIPHQIYLSPLEKKNITHYLQADPYEIPLADESIDLVLLPHTFNLLFEPDNLLAEVNRVLAGNGYLIIVNFNPMSLWGMARLFKQFKYGVPWDKPFITSLKLRYRLHELGYKIMEYDTFFYRPPFTSRKQLKRWLALETFGMLSWTYPGGLYILVAKKMLPTLTPIQPIWSFKSIVVGKRFAHPTT